MRCPFPLSDKQDLPRKTSWPAGEWARERELQSDLSDVINAAWQFHCRVDFPFEESKIFDGTSVSWPGNSIAGRPKGHLRIDSRF